MPDDLTVKRLGGEVPLDAAYQPAHYSADRTGPGRWFLLEAHGDELGYVWTNGRDAMGFAATTDAGRTRTPEFTRAFQAAAAVGTPPADVFDHWAAMASLGLSAGPVENGDLDTLGA